MGIIRKYLVVVGVLIFFVGVGIGVLSWRELIGNSINKFPDRINNDKGILSTLKDSVVFRPKELKATSFITPHHLVGNELIEEIFTQVAKKNKKQKIDRIILVSPNHFDIGHGEVIVADDELETDEGKIVATDKYTGQILTKLDFVFGDKDAFYKEHGILNLLPFVQKHFPNIPVINIMIKDGVSSVKMNKMAEAVNNLPGNTLVILSSDFSHYLSQTVSGWHDEKAVDVISHFDYPAIYNLETDCVTGLYFLMRFSELKNQHSFVWVDNSNSSEIYKEDLVGENTSYVTGYFTSDSKINKSSSARLASLLFFGDVMLDRQNRTVIKNNSVGFFTDNFERLFWGQDLNIINLEGPIIDRPSVSVGVPMSNPNHFRFTFNPEQSINFLQANRINLVNIGNNHILNFHNNGLEQTENILAKGNVSYFGNPLDLEKMVVIKNVNNREIAFVNYNQFGKFSTEDTLKIIRQTKNKTEFVIVYAHWGVEYDLGFSKKQQSKAHQFIEAGADLVIGSHPHVVQPLEIYQGKAIFYSLGNFVFDQYFSEDVKSLLGLGVSLSNKQVEFRLIPLYRQNGGQLNFMDSDRKKVFLQNLSERSIISKEKKEELKKGVIQLSGEDQK